MGAGLALPDGSYWQFVAGTAEECQLAIEESLWVDGAGRPHPIQQLVLQGMVSRGGGTSPGCSSGWGESVSDVTIKRALLSVSDKSGLAELGAALAARGVELVSTGGTAQGTARGRARGEGRVRPDRLSRDDGRAGQDAAPDGPWRDPRGARRSRACGVDGRARDRRDRPAGGQSLPVRGDRARAARSATRWSRTSTSAARRWCARRRRTTPIVDDRHRSRRLRGAAGRTRRERRRDHAGLPQGDGRQGLRRDRVLRCGDRRRGSPSPTRARPSPNACRLRCARATSCATARTRTRRRRSICRSAPGCRASRRPQQLQGKELSYNNYNDADAALELIAEFRDGPPTVAIIKHANPCGVAQGASLLDAYTRGLRLRPGLGLRRDRRLQPPARCGDGGSDHRHLHRSRDRAGGRRCGAGGLRREEEPAPAAGRRTARSAPRPGSRSRPSPAGCCCSRATMARSPKPISRWSTKRAPTEQEVQDCLFAWTIAKHVKSNAIVYAKDGVTAGIGAGQMNRRDSSRIAAIRAREAAEEAGWAQPRTVGCGGRLGRLLPVPRRLARRGRSRRDRGDPARRRAGRRQGDRRGGRGGTRDGVHRDAPLPALIGAYCALQHASSMNPGAHGIPRLNRQPQR